MAELVRRPELSYVMLSEIDPERRKLSEDTAEQVNREILSMRGISNGSQQQVTQFKKLESKRLDVNFDYSTVHSLRKRSRTEAESVQANVHWTGIQNLRVSPADISVLLVHLEQLRHQGRSETDEPDGEVRWMTRFRCQSRRQPYE